VHVNGGVLTTYAGDYQYYLEKTNAGSARAALTAGAQGPAPAVRAEPARPAVDRKEQKRLEAEQRQARSNQRKAQQQVVHKLEKRFQVLELRQATLTAELEKQETYESPGRAMQINRELVEVQDELTDLTAEWEAQAGKLESEN